MDELLNASKVFSYSKVRSCKQILVTLQHDRMYLHEKAFLYISLVIRLLQRFKVFYSFETCNTMPFTCIMTESLHARMISLEFEYFVVELDKRYK